MLGVALLCENLKSAAWKDRLMSAQTGRVSREQVAAEVELLVPHSLKALVESIFAKAALLPSSSALPAGHAT